MAFPQHGDDRFYNFAAGFADDVANEQNAHTGNVKNRNGDVESRLIVGRIRPGFDKSLLPGRPA